MEKFPTLYCQGEKVEVAGTKLSLVCGGASSYFAWAFVTDRASKIRRTESIFFIFTP
jgi:hypothetical protein